MVVAVGSEVESMVLGMGLGDGAESDMNSKAKGCGVEAGVRFEVKSEGEEFDEQSEGCLDTFNRAPVEGCGDGDFRLSGETVEEHLPASKEKDGG
jgi:hypothetical protein